MKILNTSGGVVASYTYDAWGKVTSSGSIGQINPIRYRGYYYDTDTGFYYLQSRYYDPAIKRFINADGYVNANGDLIGFNMFAYCVNNPVNTSDPTGTWPQWIKNSVKWVAKNIVRPVVKTAQQILSKVDLTYSSGLNVSGTPSFWIFNGQIGPSIDTKGNVALQASVGGGLTTGDPCLAISRYRSITNASSIYKLNGEGYQIGGSFSALLKYVLLAAGGDFNIIPDSDGDQIYYGRTTTGGLAIGKPGGEFHVEWGKTFTIPGTEFNIFDVSESIYEKIMEW